MEFRKKKKKITQHVYSCVCVCSFLCEKDKSPERWAGLIHVYESTYIFFLALGYSLNNFRIFLNIYSIMCVCVEAERCHVHIYTDVREILRDQVHFLSIYLCRNVYLYCESGNEDE